MIEGLWVVKFLTPNDPTMELNGGVVVVETGKIYGGDSGYFYVGSMEPSSNGVWNTTITITRHDPDIESIFGDIDTFDLTGQIKRNDKDTTGRPTLIAKLAHNGAQMTAVLYRVADLP